MVLRHQAKEHPVRFAPISSHLQCNRLLIRFVHKISLAAVNFFLGAVGVIQVSRILIYQNSVEGKTAKQQLEAAKESAVGAAEGLKVDVKSVVAN